MNVAAPWPVRLLAGFCLGWHVLVILAVGALQVALGGCAAWHAPERVDTAALRGRAVSATAHDVRLSAAVLSADDSRQMFGADVNGTGVQPVWVEVENRTPSALWLLRSGTDPDYFSPLEVSWSLHGPLVGSANAALDAHLVALSFQNPVLPGATRAGIIFTNPQRHTRLLNVDFLGQRTLIPFTLFLPVPDSAPDEQSLQMLVRRADAPAVDYREPDALRAALEQLPCCAMGPDGTAAADPLNVVMIGTFADIAAALTRRGFRRDAQALDRAQRLFGRPPDAVVRKSGQGGVPAHWMRVWIAPLRYQGQSVFLVQAGRPVGGRFAVAEGKDLVLHPDVDEARNLLIQDLLYSGGLAQLGFVAGVGLATVDQPRHSLAGTTYHTDGLRAVMFFATRPLALSDVRLLDWVPYLERREIGTAAEHTHGRP
jgi:hypothetical protein